MAGLNAPRPLRADDDCQRFDCGREALNQWLRRHGWRNQQTGASRTTVMTNIGGAIIGYVSICATDIRRDDLKKPHRRDVPDPVPAVLLGQLAVDLEWQGKCVANALMVYALSTAVEVSKKVGCIAVVTRPIDDHIRAFYRDYLFYDLGPGSGGAMAVRIEELVGWGYGASQRH